jgi:hypothetical protein
MGLREQYAHARVRVRVRAYCSRNSVMYVHLRMGALWRRLLPQQLRMGLQVFSLQA